MVSGAARRGLKAKQNGDAFEDIFLRLCRLRGVSITRIPDGCRRVGKNRLVQVRTPWDWVISHRGQTALIDTKSVQGDTFPCSLIKDHQVSELLNHERSGAIAGYVIWLRENSQVFFMPASELKELMKRGGSFSSLHEKAIGLGDLNFDIRLLFNH